MPFEFATATEIVFGAGTRQIISRPHSPRGHACARRDWTRSKPQHVLLEAIRAAGVTTTVWPLAHEPTLDDAREVARVARDAEVELVAGAWRRQRHRPRQGRSRPRHQRRRSARLSRR